MKHLNIYIFFSLVLLFVSCSEDTVDPDTFGKIKGLVIDKESQEPLEGVKVESNPVSETVFTDAQGNFVLSNVPLGNVTVEATKDDYLTTFEAVNVVADEQSNTVIELLPDNVNNVLPSTPVLVSPGNGAEGIDQTIELVWNQSTDADDDDITYTLYFFKEGSSEVQEFSSLTDTTYTVDNLELNTFYYWQVSSNDEFHEEESRSEIFSFKTVSYEANEVFFSKLVEDNYIIYSANQEGENLVAVTEGSVSSWRPRQNPSTNQVAFLRNVGNEAHIFLMNPDGSDTQQVTSIPVAGFNQREIEFSWNASGDKLYYPNFSKLYRINPDGSGIEIVYETTDGSLITKAIVNPTNGNLVVKTNNNQGYQSKIIEINQAGELISTILENVTGAVGGLDISVNGQKLLYTHDVSGFENNNYRMLDSEIFLYNFNTQETDNLSGSKPNGTNDLNPRFSPNEAQVVFTNGSNVLGSQPSIYKMDLGTTNNNRVLFLGNALMVDWE